MIRILIADDHDVVRMGLRLLLEQQADMQVVGEASDGIEATEMTARLLPDILLMDISMPRMGGNEAARRIALLGLPTRIVILSMHSEEAIVRTALEGGAKGYLVKSFVRTDLAPAIHAAYRGETFLSPSIEDLVVKQFLVREPAAQDDAQRGTKGGPAQNSCRHACGRRPTGRVPLRNALKLSQVCHDLIY